MGLTNIYTKLLIGLCFVLMGVGASAQTTVIPDKLRIKTVPQSPVSGDMMVTVDASGNIKKDTIKSGSTTTHSLSFTYGFLGQPYSFNGSTPIVSMVDTTKLQTILNFFPKGDTRYAKIGGGTLTNTLTFGTGLVSGSFNNSANVTEKVDTTTIQTIANFFPKGDTRYYKSSNPSSYISRTGISATAPITYNNSTGVIGITQATTSTDGYLSSTDWNTFNGKQSQINGTGFVKASGTTISYDNSTYLTTSLAASTYQTLANLQTTLSASSTQYPSSTAVQNYASSTYVPLSSMSGTTNQFGYFSGTNILTSTSYLGYKLSSGNTTIGVGVGTIGINDPPGDVPHMFEINNDNGSEQVIKVTTAGPSGGTTPYQNNMHWDRFDGTFASPTYTKSGMLFMSMGYRGYEATNGISQSAAAFQVIASADWSATSHPAKFNFGVTNIGSLSRTDAFQIRENSDLWGSGNLILGQSDKQAWNAAYTVLTMGGNQGLRSQGNSTNSLWFNNVFYDSAWKYASNGYGSYINLDDQGVFTFATAPSGTAAASATMTPRLTIANTGAATFSSTVSTTHLIGSTSAPTIAAGTGAGTSPTVTVTGSDLGHQVNVTTGTSPTASATVATVTFNVAYTSAPKVIQLTPANSVTAALNGTAQIYVDSSSTTTTVYVIKVGSGGLAASTAYSWFATVIQ